MAMFAFFNEKGNVSAKVRENLKKQTVIATKSALENAGITPVLNANGGISIVLGTDKTSGATVYAHYVPLISTSSPFEKTTKSKGKAKTKVEEPMPDIFASTDEVVAEGEVEGE